MKKLFKSPSAVVLIFAFVFSAITYNIWKDWRSQKHPFLSDVDQYYSYVVAVFIKHDLTFSFPNSYWLSNPKDIGVPKVSMGMAYMYTPFFAISHVVASVSDKYEADGYSKPYAYGLQWGSIIYCLLGLVFLRKLLLIFFDEWPTALTLISLFFGTNLFYYSLGWPLVSHGYLFFLYSALIYLVVKWHQNPSMKSMMWMGFIIGLCAVVRPIDVLVALIPLLYGIYSKESLLQKIQLLKTNMSHLRMGFLLFWLPVIPQLIYWKWATGSFLYFSYGGERFFFDDPQITNFLFSYRKGWLLYTPIMIFALVGFVWMKKFKNFSYASLFYVVLMIYILSCWWCWWFGGSFGMRSMVESYAILAVPMAAFYTYIYTNKVLKFIFVRLMVVFIYFNILQTWQYKKVTLHWDGVNKEVYWEIFGEWDRSNLTQSTFDKVKSPDYEKAIKGDRDDDQ